MIYLALEDTEISEFVIDVRVQLTDWKLLRVIFWVHRPMKMEQTQYSETSAIKHHTPGNNPKDYMQHLEHGDSLNSRLKVDYCYNGWKMKWTCAVVIIIRT
jgi:hypothetical protein